MEIAIPKTYNVDLLLSMESGNIAEQAQNIAQQ